MLPAIPQENQCPPTLPSRAGGHRGCAAGPKGSSCSQGLGLEALATPGTGGDRKGPVESWRWALGGAYPGDLIAIRRLSAAPPAPSPDPSQGGGLGEGAPTH